MNKQYLISILLISSSTSQCFASCPAGLSTWMSDHYQVIQHKKLTELTLPGAHDAGMYKAVKCTSFKIGGPAPCNTQNQELDIANQLQCGVRYFDLRPVYDADQKFSTGHFSHNGVFGILGCQGGSLADILKDIAWFAASHPKELIILRFSHYYDRKNDVFSFSRQIADQLIQTVASHELKPFLVKSEKSLNLLNMHYREIISKGNVIVLFDDIKTQWSKGILNAFELPIYDQYSNTNDFKEMMSDQFNKLGNHGNHSKRLFLLSWTLTQSKAQAATCSLDPTGMTTSIQDLAKVPNKNIGLIFQNMKVGKEIPNIIYTDFVDGQGVSPPVATLLAW